MGAFRWLRDHYTVIQVVSGVDARRARAAALLPPRLVAARRAEPRARRDRSDELLTGQSLRWLQAAVELAASRRATTARAALDLREHARDVDAAVPGANGPSRRAAFSSCRSPPTRPAAARPGTRRRRRARAPGRSRAPPGSAARQATSSSSCASKKRPARMSSRPSSPRLVRRLERSHPRVTLPPWRRSCCVGSTSSSGASSRRSCPSTTSSRSSTPRPPDLVIVGHLAHRPGGGRGRVPGRPDPRLHEPHRHRRPARRARRRLRPGGREVGARRARRSSSTSSRRPADRSPARQTPR